MAPKKLTLILLTNAILQFCAKICWNWMIRKKWKFDWHSVSAVHCMEEKLKASHDNVPLKKKTFSKRVNWVSSSVAEYNWRAYCQVNQSYWDPSLNILKRKYKSKGKHISWDCSFKGIVSRNFHGAANDFNGKSMGPCCSAGCLIFEFKFSHSITILCSKFWAG